MSDKNDTARDQALTEIARRHLGFPTLERANSDRADFREVAKWQVQQALLAAFEAGRASTQK